jgi:hypothetical protein
MVTTGWSEGGVLYDDMMEGLRRIQAKAPTKPQCGVMRVPAGIPLANFLFSLQIQEHRIVELSDDERAVIQNYMTIENTLVILHEDKYYKLVP